MRSAPAGSSRVKVAAVQAAPVFLDLAASLDKAVGLIAEAAEQGAQLVVFPEAFLPAWPAWVDEVLPGEDAAWYVRLLEQSVVVPGPVTERLGRAAHDAGVHLVIGINEREERGGTVYNTTVYFGPDGRLLGKHRKLVPTHAERLVWGMGDGSDLQVHQTAVGRIGGLICWENYMPLARFAVYAQGVEVWVAPTLATHDHWVATMRHIAREGGCHVIGVAPAARFSEVPAGVPDRERLWRGAETRGDWMLDGYSVIVDPNGTVLAGPLVREEGILYADLDLDSARARRRLFDPVGHYNRPDVFRLVVNDRPKPHVVSLAQPGSGDDAEVVGPDVP
ncbi:carbon-nitrogen hydrolase family protein [Dactylosporangium sucinum]|uniref:carbon-nitrogen hydrolase family protein n=1 Tax=Dactylosporangium sucinum TaxID=1424081 RepID=UPI00167E88EC|nr:carbon-nitrogen hydrolase family protein [Dactylosporangium sucinum]